MNKRVWDVALGILAPLMTIIGILIGVWQFNQGERNKVTLEYDLVARKDKVDYQRRLWLTKLEVYRSIARLAGQIAAANGDRTALDKIANQFTAAYWGETILVEDKPVEKAMVDLNTEIATYDKGYSSPSRIKLRVDALVAACRTSIKRGESI